MVYRVNLNGRHQGANCAVVLFQFGHGNLKQFRVTLETIDSNNMDKKSWFYNSHFTITLETIHNNLGGNKSLRQFTVTLETIHKYRGEK